MVGTCGVWVVVLQLTLLLIAGATGVTGFGCGAWDFGAPAGFFLIVELCLVVIALAPPAAFRSAAELLSITLGWWLPSVKAARASTWSGELNSTRLRSASTCASPKSATSTDLPFLLLTG